MDKIRHHNPEGTNGTEREGGEREMVECMAVI